MRSEAELEEHELRVLDIPPAGWRAVSVEALVLALTTVVRPTTATAVVAMLASRNPQRLLACYIVAGLAFSLAVGVLVAVVLQGLSAARPSMTERPVIDTALGVLALCYAGCVWIGWLPRQGHGDRLEDQGLVRKRLRNLTPSGAVAAGVLTHLPGLVYLAALNAIVASASGVPRALFQVVVYNVIWFSLPIAALAVSTRRPDAVSNLLEQLGRWAREHRRSLLIGFFGLLGGYLLVIGIQGLLAHRP